MSDPNIINITGTCVPNDLVDRRGKHDVQYASDDHVAGWQDN